VRASSTWPFPLDRREDDAAVEVYFGYGHAF
jgi:hypothetical protein